LPIGDLPHPLTCFTLERLIGRADPTTCFRRGGAAGHQCLRHRLVRPALLHSEHDLITIGSEVGLVRSPRGTKGSSKLPS